MARHDRSPRLWMTVLLAMGLGATAACEEALTKAPTGVPADDVAQLVAVSSTVVVADTATFVTVPLELRVVGSDGRPIQSATVRYSLVQGSGAFSSDSTVTNDQGFTEASFTPDVVGTHRIEARVQRAGSTNAVVFTVVVPEDFSIPASLIEIGGDGQAATITEPLPEPFVVQVLDRAGNPVVGHTVTFTIEQAQGDGALIGTSRRTGISGQLVVQTDDAGLAQAFLTLGDEVGIHTVTARAVVTVDGRPSTETITFTAAAEPDLMPAKLEAVSGQTQTVVVDTLHERGDPDFRGRDPNPFVVRAVNQFGEPVSGVTVRWRVSDGGGTLATFTTTTDVNGIAQNALFNPTAGSNVVVAFAAGLDPVQFTVTGEVLEPEEEPAEGDGGGDGGGGDGGDGGDGDGGGGDGGGV